MIKSKLIMVISSIGLVVTLGVGGIFLNSNKEVSQDNTVKTESVEQASKDVVNEDGTEVVNEEDTNDSTDNNVNSEEANLTEEVANNDSNINSNNEEDNYVSGVESEVVVSNEPSYNNSPSNVNLNTQSEIPVVSESNYIAEIEQAIFQRVNQERSAAGLPALSYNTTMENYARIKSKDMGDNGYFSHEDQQGNLITVKMQADGVSYRAWGENIAYIQGVDSNSALATKFMDNWMNSSGHRANILSTNFSSIGIGVYKIGNTYYATQEFYK